MNNKEFILEALWEKLGRYARAHITPRRFLIEEITHLLSCDPTLKGDDHDRQNRDSRS